MAISTIAETIRERVKMADVFERYGFTPNRGGFISCPFHEEDTPSLGTYADGSRFKCFGCGKSGSVIDFVMELYGLDFRQAAARLNLDFGLGLLDQPLSYSMRRKAEQKQRARRQQRAEELRIREQYRLCNVILRTKAPTSMDETPCKEFIWALHNRDRLAAELNEKERR